MSSDSFLDFEKPWEMADVVLHTEESDGKELHANKSILAIFSPYYRALFFHDFKEKNDSVVTVRCRFDTMKEILKHIHHVDFDYSPKGLRQYEAPMLVDLYRVADLYDFPTLRKLCTDQMKGRQSVELAKAAMESDLHDLLMNILEQLDWQQVAEFMSLENATHLFSKKDVRFFFTTISCTTLRRSRERIYTSPFLEDHAPVVNSPQFDLTRPWAKGNIGILTNSPWPFTILYGNLETIEMVSHKFNASVKAVDDLDENRKWRLQYSRYRGQYVAIVDVDYTTMKEILSIIHHCNMDFASERTYHPVLLYDMYRTADTDRLDIPMIRKMCIDMLKKQNTVDAWEVMCRLSGVDLENPMYKALSPMQRGEWICRSDRHLSYDTLITKPSCHTNSVTVVITPSQTDPLFTLNMVRTIVSDLYTE